MHATGPESSPFAERGSYRDLVPDSTTHLQGDDHILNSLPTSVIVPRDMDRGQVRFGGHANELLQRDDLVRSIFLGGAAEATEMKGT
jgi:hypothetical protein